MRDSDTGGDQQESAKWYGVIGRDSLLRNIENSTGEQPLDRGVARHPYPV